MTRSVPDAVNNPLVAELRATNNRPDFAQIYLRHLAQRAADEIERLQKVTTLRDQIDALMAEVSRLSAENFRLRTPSIAGSAQLDLSKLSSEELWQLADRMGAELVKRGELRRTIAREVPS